MPVRSHLAGEAEALSVYRILAPGSLSPMELSWQVEPGETFLAGSPLATRRSSTTGTEARDILDLLVFLLSCGSRRLGRLARKQVLTAPEDGVLLWRLPYNYGWGRGRRGMVLATYLPLRDWKVYAKLLDRQQTILANGLAEQLPAMRAEETRLIRETARLRQARQEREQHERGLLQGSLEELAERLVAREAELDPAALDPRDTDLFRQLAGQIGTRLQASFPLPPAEFFALCDSCLIPLLILEERFRRIDATFLARSRQAGFPEEQKQLLPAWRERKAAIVRQLAGGGEKSAGFP